MHPRPALAWTDAAAMRAFVAARGFARPCLARSAVALVKVSGDRALRFQVSCGNRAPAAMADHVPGRVPTRIGGATVVGVRLRALDEAALVRGAAA